MSDAPKNAIIPHSSGFSAPMAVSAAAVSHAQSLIDNARAANTRRAYASSWGFFESWCADLGIDPLSAQPEQVVLYLEWRVSEGMASSSLMREYSALAFYLRSSSRQSAEVWRRRLRPHVVTEFLAGVARTYGRPAKKKRAVAEEALLAAARAPLEAWGGGLRGVRDRAIFLVGFHGGFRRSELAALERADLASVEEGAILVVRRSKTDQGGKGLVKAVARSEDLSVCPVKALSDWVKGARITRGPLFPAMRGEIVQPHPIDPRTVADVVKRMASYLGLREADFAGHSLRSGFVSVAFDRGASVPEIMLQTGHRSTEQVMDYIQRANPFRGNATMRLKR